MNKPIHKCNDIELKSIGIVANKHTKIFFNNGINISGTIIEIYNHKNIPLIIKFKNCTVKLNKKILFSPEWGIYDLICGENVVSVFGGPADFD